MMYKAFAAITLIAAPLIVLVAQSVVPQPGQPVGAVQPTTPAVQPIAPPLPMPAISTPSPALEPAPFGQPMPDAGKPFLAPGHGLPGGESPPPPSPSQEPESNDGSVPSISDG